MALKDDLRHARDLLNAQPVPPPLGNCFPEAYAAVLEIPAAMRPVLVHGYPTLTRPPFKRFAHAWVEILGGAMVFDAASGLFVEPARYFEVGKIDSTECLRYTPREAMEHANRSGHYGPWDDNRMNEL